MEKGAIKAKVLRAHASPSVVLVVARVEVSSDWKILK